MASIPSGHACQADSKSLSTPSVNPFASMGQLSIAPATQTTVVTTTTTTTTAFPPFTMTAPRGLTERDPKEYPLANVQAPDSIRKFYFEAGGTQACFEETSDVADKVQEHNSLYDNLRASNGTLRQFETFKGSPQFATPNRTRRPNVAALDNNTRSVSGRRKRSSSPPSIAEAAEIASLHRRSKKPRTFISKDRAHDSTLSGTNYTPDDTEDAVLATPDTAAASFKLPRQKPSSRRTKMRSSSHASRRRHMLESATSAANVEANASNCQARSLSDTHSSAAVLDAGVAATPPIAENDLEPVGPFDTDEQTFTANRPTSLDTSSTQQDASLPSPSLSPITAAATLAQQNNTGPSFAQEDDGDDSNDVSSLDISQGNSTDMLGRLKHIDLPDPNNGFSPNPQLLTPTNMSLPNMLESFDALPEKMKTLAMFHLLRRCTKSTLHFVADVVNPALKCDFIALLPLELSLNIIGHLDVKSMCNAAQVSKKWRYMIDTDEMAWKELLARDSYTLPEDELERAIREGWGWQYPHSSESYERDLRAVSLNSKTDTDIVASSSSSGVAGGVFENELALSRSSPSRPKRKHSSVKMGPQKKQRKKSSSSLRTQATAYPRLSVQHGPNAFADRAMAAIPSPKIGLPSLRVMHLYKSLYQRHHLIRKSWMEDDARPKHIAFHAHRNHVVTCLQFDTEKILTGSDDTNINVYDTKTGALRSRLEGHEGGVWALQYEGNTLVSGSTDRSVRVWDIEKGKCTHVFHGHTSTVRCLVILKPTKIGEDSNGQPIMMPARDQIITGSRDSSLRVWNLPRPGERSSSASDDTSEYFQRALTGHHHSVRAIAAHGDTLVSGSYDCSVRVWKISNGELLYRLNGHNQKVYSVVLDTERNRCISGSMDNMVKVWSLQTGECIFTLEGHNSLVGLLDLSHGRLVSAAADSTLRIWDPENGQCKSRLRAHTGAITCFQHDGQKVISGSDRTLKMWDVQTGVFVKDLLTDLSGVWQVKFNERRCVAAVQREDLTYIEVLDFGAARDGVPADQRGRRIVVDTKGLEIEDSGDALADVNMI